MKNGKLKGILLSTLLVTSLMVPLLTVALVSVPYAQSYPPADNDHMDPTTAIIGLMIFGLGSETLTVHGPTTVERGNPYDPGDGHEKIDTEIISMSLTGVSTLTGGPITIIESPTKSSSGAIRQQYPGYDFPADSFFDVFVEIQTVMGTFHNDDPVPMEATIYSIPPWGSTYTSTAENIPLKNENDNIVGFITHVSHSIPPVYFDNLRDLTNPVSSRLHELFPEFSRRYHLTSWIDTNGDNKLSSCDKIDITDNENVVTWWHVDNVTITMLVENLENIEQIMYIELDPKLFPMWESIKYAPVCTMWHEIWPVFSRWYHLSSWEDDGDLVLDYCDNIDITDEETGVVSWWHVLDVKYDIIVQQIPPPKYLDNLYDLRAPVSSQLHELYPEYCRRYHLTSWIDTNRDGELSSSDIIDITDNENVVTWWHVDVVTITMLVENLENMEQIMYIELDPKLFPFWENIKRSPVCTMWHEIWPVFSRWYHLSSWKDDGDLVLDYCDNIDITDEETGVVSWWHVLDVKYDIIVQIIPPPEEFKKENMPDLGQHCINWCWTAAAANSIKWWAEYRGYKELLDDPSDNVLDENYLQLLPGVCPWDPVLRLLVEIAKDCLFPGVPENEIPDNLTWCSPVFNAQYFYGLQEFIREQGAPLYVHEIVDNDHFAGHPEPIPPEDGENVIYDQPTFENYKREIKRCQDVLLQLDFRNAGLESDPPGTEALDHIVTGVSFFDGGPGNQWIEVADPWTPVPWPGPVGGPDHNNDENRFTYERLPVVSEDPLVVTYTGENPPGWPVTVDVQVVKLIYISPIVTPWTGTATFKLENLYKVSLEKDLQLNTGSKLVVKFYDYLNNPENEVVIENITPPENVVENENVPHPPGGSPPVSTAVKKAELVLTTDNTMNVISTIASFTVHQSHLRERNKTILKLWGGHPELWGAFRAEVKDILKMWANAPP